MTYPPLLCAMACVMIEEVDIPSRQSVSDLLSGCVEKILLPRFRTLKASQIHRKGDDSVVTDADWEAERFLEQGLRRIIPNAIVLGEEGIANDKKRLITFLQERRERPVWLVDPLDGTRNFVNRSQVFCSMIALVYDQQTCASWIYAHSDNCIMHARQGGGVFVDDTPLASPPSAPSSALPRGRISWTKQPLSYDEQRIERLPSVRCAGQDFVDLTRGRTDFSYYNSLWPWDHAAGGFLLESAGGRIAHIKTGETPSPLERTAALLATKRKEDWQALQKIFDARTKEETHFDKTLTKNTTRELQKCAQKTN